MECLKIDTSKLQLKRTAQINTYMREYRRDKILKILNN